MDNVPKKIKDVVDDFRQDLIDKGYNQNSQWKYGKACRFL